MLDHPDINSGRVRRVGAFYPGTPHNFGRISRPDANTAPEQKLSRWVRLFPIIFFITYLNFTVALFAFGPWLYPVQNGFKLYVFLAIAHLALLTGYLSAAFRQPKDYFGRWNVRSIAGVSLVLNLILIVPTAWFRTGAMFPDVAIGIVNPGDAYALSNALREEGKPLVEYIRIALGPVLFLLLPTAVFYWRRLNLRVKVGAIVGVLGGAAIFVATGTNKGVADIVLLIPWLVVPGVLSGILRLKWTRKVAVMIVCVFAFASFLWFFSTTQSERQGAFAKYGVLSMMRIPADYGHFVLRNLPSGAQIGVLGLSSYLSQGYYALYLSLDKPFVPMFGIGNSMFLYRQAVKLTGWNEIEDMPYPARIQEDGWDAYGLWSSIYPWIASDVSFLGTILVVFLIGRFLALSWLDSLRGANPFAVAMFAQFVIMIYYFPANNQCFQSGESLTAFLGVFLLWIFTRRKYVWKAN